MGKPAIVFMGTPEFAVDSLRALVEGGYRVAGVVTVPDILVQLPEMYGL